jgi:hypothetical protein
VPAKPSQTPEKVSANYEREALRMPMSSHKFKLGELVDVSRVPSGYVDPRPCEIVRLLPPLVGIPRYVIKTGNEDL